LKKKKLVILTTSLKKAGAETQAVRMAVGMSERGWSVTIISLLPICDFVKTLKQAGVEYKTLNIKSFFSLFGSSIRLLKILRKIKPVVMVTFNYHANILGKVLGRLSGVSVIASIRNEFFGGVIREKLEQATGRLAKLTTTNSRIVARSLVERKIANREKIQFIPNMITIPDLDITPEQKNEIRHKAGCGAVDFLWISVGRLEKAKNIPCLIKAFEVASAQLPDIRLAVVGYGSLENEIMGLIEKSSAIEKIKFLGEQNNILELMASSNAFVMSSVWEGMPNAVIEAMSMGLPVVATSVGGVEELVDNQAGIVVPPFDSLAIADAIINISSRDTKEQKGMGLVGKQRIISNHETKTVLDMWEKTINNVGNNG
jgi:glycosyltransferase involved in cell wall biosynthesis